MADKIFADLKVSTDDQLATRLSELKREQFNLRFQAATGQLESPGRVRIVRRTIARIKTLVDVVKTPESSLVGHLNWGTFMLRDVVQKSGGAPFGN